MSVPIKYCAGFKYQLVDSWHDTLSIHPDQNISLPFSSLNTSGLLILKEGNACDGPSGPTIDTPDSMKGAFVHDELCKMVRYGLLDTMWKEKIDAIARDIWVESGMTRERADLWYNMLRQFDFYIDPNNKREILIGP